MIIAKIFACAILFMLAVLGLSVAVRFLSALLLKGRKNRLISVVLLDGVDTEFTIRSAAAAHSLWPFCSPERIYAVDCGMNPENLRIARVLSRMYPFISVIDIKDFVLMAQDLNFPEYRIKAE